MKVWTFDVDASCRARTADLLLRPSGESRDLDGQRSSRWRKWRAWTKPTVPFRRVELRDGGSAALCRELTSDNVMGGDIPFGHLLALNGGSSAGKTTLARKLQSSLVDSWLLLGIDLLMWTLPPEMVGDQRGIQIIDGEIRRGAEFMRLYAGFQRAVASLVASGIDVVLDEVLLDGSEDQCRWDEALGDLPVCWVAVHCDPDTVAKREQERGDRPPGIAVNQATSVHRGVRYDIELDTGLMSVVDSVTLLAGGIRQRWSISSTQATDTPPGLPPTSAWSPDSTQRLAPWER